MGDIVSRAGDGFVLLQAIDPQLNVARRYYIEMSTDLFGAIVVEYGVTSRFVRQTTI